MDNAKDFGNVINNLQAAYNQDLLPSHISLRHTYVPFLEVAMCSKVKNSVLKKTF